MKLLIVQETRRHEIYTTEHGKASPFQLWWTVRGAMPTVNVNRGNLWGSMFCFCLLRLGLAVTGAPAENFGTRIHGVETGATKRLAFYRMASKQCSTWWHCCAVLSLCWALGSLSVAVFGLGVVCQCPLSFHTEREASSPSAKRNRKMLKFTAQTFFILWSWLLSMVRCSYTTKFQQSLALQLCVILFCY